jgi:hypothetical protein
MVNKIALILLCSLLCFFALSFSSVAESENGIPIKCLNSCEADFNSDNKQDIAILIETKIGWELIVLIRNGSSYKPYVLAKGKQDMKMSCHFGMEIKETIAGEGKRKVRIHKTNGTYLQIIYPEASSVVYFWKDNKFKEIWTSD